MKFKLSWIFLFLGCISALFFGIQLWLRHRPIPIIMTPDPLTHQLKAAAPTLSFPDLGITLPIIEASKSGSTWPLSSNGVIHLADTPLPGSNGNSHIYGHNWANLLAPLHQLKVGQTIYITGYQPSPQKFTIDRILIVSPDQISVLNPTDSPQLTVYTCTGFLDSQRLVVIALPG